MIYIFWNSPDKIGLERCCTIFISRKLGVNMGWRSGGVFATEVLNLIMLIKVAARFHHTGPLILKGWVMKCLDHTVHKLRPEFPVYLVPSQQL